MSKRLLAPASLLTQISLGVSTLALAGCAFSGSSLTSATPSASAGKALYSGSVHGGQQPIAGATVSLWTPGITGATAASYGANPTLIATTTTDALGGFSFNNVLGQSPCTTGQLLYITATGGNSTGSGVNSSSAMMVALPQACNTGQQTTAQTSVVINELTTVAAVWALQQFMTINPGGTNTTAATASVKIGAPSTNLIGLTNAFLFSSEVTNPASGMTATSSTSNSVPSTIGGNNYNTFITPDYKKVNTLGNILSACINTAGTQPGGGDMCSTLFADSTPTGSPAPTDTLQVAYYLATRPAGLTMPTHGAISAPSYQCSTYPPAAAPFQPNTTCTNLYDWTINVNWVTRPAGSTTAVVGTTNVSSLGIDGNGNVWTGAGSAATANLVNQFNPQGQLLIPPVSTATIPGYNFNVDYSATSTISYAYAGSTQNLTFGRAFSLALDTANNAWFSSFNVATGPVVNGASSQVTGLLTQVSPTGNVTGYLAGASTGALALDGSNNVFLSDNPASLVAASVRYYDSELTAASSYQTLNQGVGRGTTQFGFLTPDGLGNVYAFNATTSCAAVTIPQLTTANEASATLVSVPTTGMCTNAGAVDAANNLYITGSGNLTYLNLSTGIATPIQTIIASSTQNLVTGQGGLGGVDNPVGLQLDGAGNIWVVNRLSSTLSGVSELVPTTTGTTTTATALSPSAVGAFGFGTSNGYSGANGLAIDPSGNVWIMTTAGSALNYIIGAAAPVVTPISVQAQRNAFAVRP